MYIYLKTLNFKIPENIFCIKKSSVHYIDIKKFFTLILLIRWSVIVCSTYKVIHRVTSPLKRTANHYYISYEYILPGVNAKTMATRGIALCGLNCTREELEKIWNISKSYSSPPSPTIPFCCFGPLNRIWKNGFKKEEIGQLLLIFQVSDIFIF